MNKKEMEKKYADKKPIAVYPMGNWGGIEVLDVDYGINDYVICRYNFGEPEKTIHRVKIRYGVKSTYFVVEGTTVPLTECVKV